MEVLVNRENPELDQCLAVAPSAQVLKKSRIRETLNFKTDIECSNDINFDIFYLTFFIIIIFFFLNKTSLFFL